MKISAQTVAHSISPQGHKIWSGLLTFPKYLLAEAKTHRILSQDTNETIIEVTDVSLNAARDISKNSASSRAIPFNRMIQSVIDNPFIPIAWMKDHKGMQGVEYFTDDVSIFNRRTQHLMARDTAVNMALTMSDLEVTKQICNRYLEYFMYTTVLVTGTEWENFFELRCPDYIYKVGEDREEHYRSKKDFIKAFPMFKEADDMFWLTHNSGQAEIHMMALAEAIWDAQNESVPEQLLAGQWHIPFRDKITESQLDRELGWLDNQTNIDYAEWLINNKVKISTAMAARTSYTVVGDEKEIGYDKLIGIHDRMAEAKPFHASPFEHCNKAMSDEEYYSNIKGEFAAVDTGSNYLIEHFFEKGDREVGWCRNMRGFIQYRHILENQKL